MYSSCVSCETLDNCAAMRSQRRHTVTLYRNSETLAVPEFFFCTHGLIANPAAVDYSVSAKGFVI